ncbi:MAG: tetratricopeptide repeat protein [Bacteroidia bacterium]|nr:tetratricopeptide repeat protein [Bacteroidia bacterium]
MTKIIFFSIFLCCFFTYSQNTTDKERQIFGIDNNEDIAKIFLELEKELNPVINIEAYINKINSLVYLITCELDNCYTIQDSIKIINQQLFQKQQLSFQEDCEFISNIFDRNCGNCASLSAYYIAVASRLGIKSLYPVLAPNHVFIKYDYNGIKINIETTQKGENYSDQWYRNYFGVSEKVLLSDTYFRNLSQKEFIAVLINNRGTEFLRIGKSEKAITDFNTAISIFPTLAEVYFGLANYYDNLGYKKTAIKQYNKVLRYNPDFANAYCNRGLLYEQSGEFDSSIADYNNALKLIPDFSEVYYNRGITYTRKENYPQAIYDFSIAIKIKPDYIDAYFNRACAKNLLHDYIGAIQDYNSAIELGHTTAETYIYRGDCRNAIGDKKEACEDWKKGFEMGYYSKNKKKLLKYCNE